MQRGPSRPLETYNAPFQLLRGGDCKGGKKGNSTDGQVTQEGMIMRLQSEGVLGEHPPVVCTCQYRLASQMKSSTNTPNNDYLSEKSANF